jgi:hypothetical protein
LGKPRHQCARAGWRNSSAGRIRRSLRDFKLSPNHQSENPE